MFYLAFIWGKIQPPLHAVLVWFQAAFGFQINLGKSVLVLVGEVSHAEELVGILGCWFYLAFSLTYLGLPLGVWFKSSVIWTLMIASLERRLDDLQRLYLSNGGRLTLLESTLSSPCISCPSFQSVLPLFNVISFRILRKWSIRFLW